LVAFVAEVFEAWFEHEATNAAASRTTSEQPIVSQRVHRMINPPRFDLTWGGTAGI
jgi:hypothetical protein